MFIIRVHEKWNDGDKRWFTTVARDAVRLFYSEHFNTKQASIASAAEFISKP